MREEMEMIFQKRWFAGIEALITYMYVIKYKAPSHIAFPTEGQDFTNISAS